MKIEKVDIEDYLNHSKISQEGSKSLKFKSSSRDAIRNKAYVTPASVSDNKEEVVQKAPDNFENEMIFNEASDSKKLRLPGQTYNNVKNFKEKIINNDVFISSLSPNFIRGEINNALSDKEKEPSKEESQVEERKLNSDLWKVATFPDKLLKPATNEDLAKAPEKEENDLRPATNEDLAKAPEKEENDLRPATNDDLAKAPEKEENNLKPATNDDLAKAPEKEENDLRPATNDDLAKASAFMPTEIPSIAKGLESNPLEGAANVKQQLSNALAAAVKKATDNANLRAEVAETKLKNIEAEISKLKELVKTAEEEKLAMQSENDRLLTDNKKLEADIEKYKNENQVYKDAFAEFTAPNSELTR